MVDFLGDIKEIEAWIKDKFEKKPEVIPTANTIVVGTPEPSPIQTGMPTAPLQPNNWPTQKVVWSTFHNNGTAAWVKENLVDVPCPWVLHMDKIVLHSIQIHKSCAESLTRILQYIWEQAGSTQEAIEKLHYDRYSGSYNYRSIRGGNGAMSMHSYGLAIDFDAEENEQHSPKHLFQADSLIVKAFKAESAIWGGDWSPSSIDAMHFQFCKVS